MKKTQNRSNVQTYTANTNVKIWDSSKKIWISGTVIESNAIITSARVFSSVLNCEITRSFKTFAVLPA